MANKEVAVSKKRKFKEVAIYGNYKHYYGYRIKEDMKEDPRFTVLKKEWFQGKDCLDIGCNQGLITIKIAKQFFCRSIVGIDIDASLVETAYWNLKRISKMDSTASQSSKTFESELSEANGLLEQRDPLQENTNVYSKNLFDRVSFREENFVEGLCRHSEIYDTILCLSVTKWIHLNWGDDGLVTLFANIWRLLRPVETSSFFHDQGGIFLLEPQPWKSYQSNHLVSETAAWNYHNIVLEPRHFQEILLDKVGFKTVENITERLPGSVAGFDRPIFIFRK